jgi:tRNA(Arg) A34 adenosine deaminase TadA
MAIPVSVIRMSDPENFMKRAIELARQGMRRGDGGPFGAVVVRDGEIIGEGWNRVLATNDPTAHAEITVIRAACARLGSFSLDGCEIHTTGEPCPMCLGAIQWARLGAIYQGFRVEEAAEIGFDDREFYRQLGLPPGQRRIPTHESCRAEALELLREYNQLPRKRSY